MAVIDEKWRGLSVIMPAYNAAQTIAEQLEALASQDYAGQWELLVVDNRSTDDTAGIVQRYARQGRPPRLRLVRAAERQGRAYACNVGARAAAGSAFIFCDADDVADAGWLSALAQALQQHEFVAATIEVESLNTHLPWHPRPPNWAAQSNLGFLPFAGGALMAVSRRAFEALGGFDEAAPFCEDIELSWRLQLAGYALQPVPGAIMHVRYRGSLDAMWRQTDRFAQAHVYLYHQFAAHGMPRSSRHDVWRGYVSLARTARRLWGKDERARAQWIRQAATYWGHLKGSLRYFTLFL
jgi:GT2 family glycosyltransferase